MKAGVSLASWRRWESDPSSVSPDIAFACESALVGRVFDAKVASAWESHGRLTPRQAAAFIHTLSWWADLELGEWLRSREEPLHEVGPFCYFDVRVMMLVGDNAAFAAAAMDRCRVVAEEIERGVLPFDRPGCFFDEVLMAAALPAAQAVVEDEAEMLEGIPARSGTKLPDHVDLEDVDWDNYEFGDSDWDSTSDYFDDEAYWGDWEVPVMSGYVAIPLLLERFHPFRWFDIVRPISVLDEIRGAVALVE